MTGHKICNEVAQIIRDEVEANKRSFSGRVPLILVKEVMRPIAESDAKFH